MCCESSTLPMSLPTAPQAAPDGLHEQHRRILAKAERCFRLARTITDLAVAHLLEEIGEDYLHQAERLMCNRCRRVGGPGCGPRVTDL